ncbi:hypothetical protein [Thioalkalivibrio sp. ALJ15]|uniref:hypothetical protein n=1 Tax=Thioalkalivibrio sp. ALJ15 TaxID=748652 RepID=UPI0003705587
MVVAVVTMGVMQVAVYQVVHVVPVRNGLVAAAGTVHVIRVVTLALMVRGAVIGVRFAHLDDMLVNMVAMRMVEMTIMQVIHVSVVLHRGVSAAGSVFMIVIRMFLATHDAFSCWTTC